MNLHAHNLPTDLDSPLFQNFPVPLFACEAEEQHIVGANAAAVARYGYSSDQLLAMCLSDLSSREARTTLHGAIECNPRVTYTVVRQRTSCGEEFEAELHFAPCHYGAREVLLVAVSESMLRTGGEMRRDEEGESFRVMLEECPFGIFRTNLETQELELVNPALLQASGYTLEELRSQPGRNMYSPPEDRARFLSQLLKTGTVRDFATRFVTRRGEVRSVLISGSLYSHPETGVRYAQGYVLDVSRQRELEEQVSHSHRMESVGRLAGGVAHDFNNITLSISLACESALEKQLPPELQSTLLDIMRETKRAADITRQLLAFSRRQVLQPRVVDLNESLRHAGPLLTRTLGLDVKLEMELDDAIEHVFIDPEQLLLALMHMADNAREAMPRGGWLRMATRRGSEGTTVLTMADTGIGMDAITQSHIFEPFYSTKPGMPATGLGLSTVHGIITQSKGRITCVSKPGKGTTFRIELPTAKAAEPAARETPVAVKLNGVHVLLAEDDRIVNKNLKQALEMNGYEVDATANGEEALKAFDAARHHLLITDIMMPVMNGVELTRCLRQRHPGLPVLLISGFSAENEMLHEIPGGPVSFLQKPFPIKRLIEAIREAVGDTEDREAR
ncbi:MAG: response regulator [Acidobacteriota bacterium]|nr:response regulator [Acidobacteriota bacterium]